MSDAAQNRMPVHPQSISECAELLRWRADMGRRSGFEGSTFALPPYTQATLTGIAAELEYIADFIEDRGPRHTRSSEVGSVPDTKEGTDGGHDPSAATSHRWVLRSRDIHEVVVAADQWEAWDTLRGRSIYEFGLVVTAEPDEAGDGENIPVRTAALMRRWGRDEDAEQFDALAREAGLL